jgi:hypothetical protein
MPQVSKFYLRGFCLVTDAAALLVHIERSAEMGSIENRFSELPEWVLRSPHVIWLATKGESVYQRALDGESLRDELLQKCFDISNRKSIRASA